MLSALNITNISKSYGYHQVLNGVSFNLNLGERIGLVGPNGVGKSTLLKIITGEVEADGGTISLPTDRKLGYLAQVMAENEAGESSRTLQEMIDSSFADLLALENQMRELEAHMATSEGDAQDAIMETYGEVADRFERYGGYELDHRVDQVLTGLGIAHLDRERPFATLSGGEKTRVGLAMLLLGAPDVLLLDEPTNHLDFASLTWLEEYLQNYRGAVLIVSHDRHFLNRTASAIIELDEHTRSARRFAGDYDAYHAQKLRERRKWAQEWVNQQEEIRQLRLEIKETGRRNDNYRTHTDGDKFIRNAKIAQHDTTVSKRVRGAEERLSRILDNPIPKPPNELGFDYDFDQEAFKGNSPLWVSGITKRFDERDGKRVILDNVSFALNADSRIILVGPNGAGKSTLLRILVGEDSADRGEIYLHPAARLGYLAQERHTRDVSLSAFEAYLDGLEGQENQLKARLLEMGLFRYDELDKQLGQLSAGQQRKLQIARLIAERANLLILDEPTNHVSFDVLEGMEAALRNFPGAVIAATHDRRFMQNLCADDSRAQIWEVRDGQIVTYLGGYEEYIDSQRFSLSAVS